MRHSPHWRRFEETATYDSPLDDEDDEVCVECGKGGFLTGCDDCGREFHFSCVGLSWPPQEEAWSCPVCNPASAEPSAPADAETFECDLCFERKPREMETARIAAEKATIEKRLRELNAEARAL